MIRAVANCILVMIRVFLICAWSYMLTINIMDHVFCPGTKYQPKMNMKDLEDLPEDYFDNWTLKEKLDWVDQFSCANKGLDWCYEARRAAYEKAVNLTRMEWVHKQREEKRQAERKAHFANLDRQLDELKQQNDRQLEELKQQQKAEKEAKMWQTYFSYAGSWRPSIWHYTILGLKDGASKADIKKAYRARALQYHPDKACKIQKDCEEMTKKFKAITDARDALLNN